MTLAAMSVASADAQQFSMTGVVVVEGQSRVWLQEPSLTQNRIVVVRVGESVGPYRVTKILEDRVELDGPAGILVVRLAGAPSAPSAPSAPTVAAIPAPEPPPNTNEKPVVRRRADRDRCARWAWTRGVRQGHGRRSGDHQAVCHGPR